MNAFVMEDETAFTAEYLAWLAELETGRLGLIRGQLSEAISLGALPSPRVKKALEWFDSHWAAEATEEFLRVCADNPQGFSLLARQEALLVLAAKKPFVAMDFHFRMPTARDRYFEEELGAVLGKGDSVACLKYCRTHYQQRDYLHGIERALYRAWSLRDPSAAWESLMAEQGLELRRIIILNQIYWAIRENTAQAAAWYKNIRRPWDKRALTRMVFRRDREPKLIPADLEFARAVDEKALWLAWAQGTSGYPVDRAAELTRVINAVPEKYRADAIKAVIENCSAEGRTKLLSSIEDEEVRGIVGEVLFPGLSPDHVPTPFPDDAAIREAFRQGPDGLQDLAARHKVTTGELFIKAVGSDWKQAMPWMFTHQTASGELPMAREWAHLVPASSLGEECLRLFAEAGPLREKLATELIERWLQHDKMTALEGLVKLPPRQARKVFLKLWIPIGVDDNKAKIRALLESIGDPAARAVAVEKWETWSLRGASPEELLEKLQLLPPGKRRTDMMTIFSQEWSLRHEELVLALGPSQDRLRDELLASGAIGLVEGERIAPAIKLAMAIKDERVFLQAAWEFRSWKEIDDMGIRFLERLAAQPAGEFQARSLSAAIGGLMHHQPKQMLELMRSTRQLPLKRALIEVRLRDSDNPDGYETYLAEAERLPPEWIPPDLFKWKKEWRIEKEPGLYWSELAANEFHQSRKLEEARWMLERWRNKDPVAARRAFWESAMPWLYVPEIWHYLDESQGHRQRFLNLRSLPRVSGHVLDAAFKKWATAEPAAATSASLLMANRKQRVEMLESALANWITADRAKAIAWVGMLPPGEDHVVAVRAVIGGENNIQQDWQWEFLQNAIDRQPGLPAHPALQESLRPWQNRIEGGPAPDVHRPIPRWHLAGGILPIPDSLPAPAVLERVAPWAREMLVRRNLAGALIEGHHMLALDAALELPANEAQPLAMLIFSRLGREERDRAIAALGSPEKAALARRWLADGAEKNPAGKEEEP